MSLSIRVYLVIVNVSAFGLWGYDKSQAVVGAARVPEWRLLTVAAAGGWGGAKLGQRFFAHTSQRSHNHQTSSHHYYQSNEYNRIFSSMFSFEHLLNAIPLFWCLLLESACRPGLTFEFLTGRVSLDELVAHVQRALSRTASSAAQGSLVQALQQRLQGLRQDLRGAWRSGLERIQDSWGGARQRVQQSSRQIWQSMRQAAENSRQEASRETQQMREVLREKWRNTVGSKS